MLARCSKTRSIENAPIYIERSFLRSGRDFILVSPRNLGEFYKILKNMRNYGENFKKCKIFSEIFLVLLTLCGYIRDIIYSVYIDIVF